MEAWLAVTPGRTPWTQKFLLDYAKTWYASQYPRLPDGAINADIFKSMAVDTFLGWRMAWDEVPVTQGLGDQDIYDRLSEYGYLYLSFTVPAEVVNNPGEPPTLVGHDGTRHVVVVWGADRDGSVSVMDPTWGAHRTKRIEEFGSPMLFAYKAPST